MSLLKAKFCLILICKKYHAKKTISLVCNIYDTKSDNFMKRNSCFLIFRTILNLIYRLAPWPEIVFRSPFLASSGFRSYLNLGAYQREAKWECLLYIDWTLQLTNICICTVPTKEYATKNGQHVLLMWETFIDWLL